MKKKVLYFYTNNSTFVQKDIEIIKSDYRVKTFSFNPTSKALTPFEFLLQIGFIIINILNAKLIVIQFGGYHSFFPCLLGKIFRVKSLIVTGGTDCVAFPSINYGNLRNNLIGKFTRSSYKLCNHIAPVHKSLAFSDYSYTENDFEGQGIKFFLPHLKVPITEIHNGYDANFWRKKGQKSSPPSFITVASGIEKESRFVLKGIDLVLKLAKVFPNNEFIIIGSNKSFSKHTPNVRFFPFIDNKELPEYYSKATFYLQLSLSEGFPNALSEAMLCECIPIVSSVGAMPDIVQNQGYILESKNINDLIAITKKAMSEITSKKQAAVRCLIESNYPINIRQKELTKLLRDLIN